MKTMLRSTGIALLLLSSATAARAETTNCTVITSLPVTINAPGIYCLNGSLSVPNGGAIWIAADHVVLDLNGHTIQGGSNGVGIQSNAENHITVRNGTVRGFEYGIALGNAGSGDGNLVEDMRVLHAAGTALQAIGRGAVVRNNVLIGNGGVPGPGARYGISVSGPGTVVKDNKLIDTGVGSSNSVEAITVFGGTGSVVEGNVISNSASAGSSPVAINFQKSVGAAAVGNRVSGFVTGIRFSSNSTGIYRDNTVGGATTPFTGGTAAGATNFTF
jgi:hypothetical protein